MNPGITIALLMVVFCAYTAYFIKFRIPKTPDRWPFSLLEVVVLWLITAHPAARLEFTIFGKTLPPLVASLVPVLLFVVGSFGVWRICLWAKRRRTE
ncbi:MAG: hypothetical protein HKN23_18040 [Verrucomicrobiales bacterium]|nr:hypothetical protein [Verrucomicrobiales bacterium]